MDLHRLFLDNLIGAAQRKFDLKSKGLHGLRRKIANAIGVDEGTVRKWFDKTIPEAEQLLKIYRGLDISPNELFGIEETKPKESIACIEIIPEKERQMIKEIEGPRHIENFVLIPIAKGKISGGSPRVVREDPDGVAIIYKDWIGDRENFTAVWMEGKCMEKTIPDGSLVGIDHSQRDIEELNNKVVAFLKEGKATIKRLKIFSETMIYGIPDNMECFRDIVRFEGEEIEQAIIGKVAWWWGRQE